MRGRYGGIRGRSQAGLRPKQPNVDDRVDALRLFSYKDHERAPGGRSSGSPSAEGRRWARSSRQALMAPIKLDWLEHRQRACITASSVSKAPPVNQPIAPNFHACPVYPCGKSDDPAQEPERRHAPRRLLSAYHVPPVFTATSIVCESMMRAVRTAPAVLEKHGLCPAVIVRPTPRREGTESRSPRQLDLFRSRAQRPPILGGEHAAGNNHRALTSLHGEPPRNYPHSPLGSAHAADPLQDFIARWSATCARWAR